MFSAQLGVQLGEKVFGTLLSALIGALMLPFAVISSAHADSAPVMPIVQAGPLVYADIEGHLFVVVVRGATDSGIFVAYSPTGIPIQ